ncbi:hypothetical protein [Vibrio aestuarianus]|uniref:hypothetical protein n=1 Tax=Vibrio aestuarianus TaxID=28171 RepID=UPI00237CAC8C|nr:hypothetical protein [Vibrio aestuarianus]MDE1219529.1 hypothetical protein [Vibrio aestuarianus]MDE1231751.1 hypothetical protein [Vibrio aestuarianus]MDE1327398.1 hypothetical protein [Vibrio aestuarianus]
MKSNLFSIRYACIIALLLAVTGCAPQLDWYEASFNNPSDELNTPITKGTSELDVIQKYGIPPFQAQLTKNRKLARYYAEHLVYEDHEFSKSIYQRERYQVDIWYDKGKVVKSHRYNIKLKNPRGTSKPFTSFEYEDYSLYQPTSSTEYNLGMIYDFKEANNVKTGTSLDQLLWKLGLPNRVLNSGEGEVFVYEHGAFNTEPGETESTLKFNSYNYHKDYFTVRQAKVVDQHHYKLDYKIRYPEVEAAESTADLSMSFSFFVKPQEWLDFCLEKGDGVCDPAVFDFAHDEPELKTLFYYAHDMDLYFVKQGRSTLFERILAMTEQGESSPDLDLLFIYRSAIPASMFAGRSNQKEIFTAEHLKPYYQKLISDEGEFANTWVNFGRPDKWYFDKKGTLNTSVHMSLTSPPSPWYAFGPVAFYTHINRESGAACTMFSSNCLKSLDELYQYNIVVPHL